MAKISFFVIPHNQHCEGNDPYDTEYAHGDHSWLTQWDKGGNIDIMEDFCF